MALLLWEWDRNSDRGFSPSDSIQPIPGQEKPRKNLVCSQKWLPALELDVVFGFVACQGAGLGTPAKGISGVAQTR